MLPGTVLPVLTGLLLTGLLTTASADSLDINLSDKSAQFKYSSRINSNTEGRNEAGVGFLYNDDDNYLFETDLLFIDVAGTRSPGLEIGVGPRLYLARDDASDSNAAAVGIGVQFRFKPQFAPRVNFSAAAYYAPGIVSFADAENMSEVGVTIGYEVIPTASIYLGYRYISVDLEMVSEKVDIDKTGMIGMKFTF
jgi:hypothetical protein